MAKRNRRIVKPAGEKGAANAPVSPPAKKRGPVARPWYRAAAGSWYVKIDGRQVPLAKGAENEAAAWAELARLRATKDAEPERDPSEVRVAEVVQRFLAHAASRVEASTLEGYTRRLLDFSAACGTVRVSELKRRHLEAWMASKGWNPTTAHSAITRVKVCLNWAVERELIRANPVAKMPKPQPLAREAILTGEQFDAIHAAASDRPFRDLLVALRDTGARPGEISRVTARIADLENGVWVFKKHKTGAKTGRDRVVSLTPRMVGLCRELAAMHPEGPLFRNEDGVAWSRQTMAKRFERVREKLGFGAEVTAYSLRHLFASDALEAGVPIASVAELMGHRDTTMVSRIYSKLRERRGHLRDQLAKFRGGDPEPGTASP